MNDLSKIKEYFRSGHVKDMRPNGFHPVVKVLDNGEITIHNVAMGWWLWESEFSNPKVVTEYLVPESDLSECPANLNSCSPCDGVCDGNKSERERGMEENALLAKWDGTGVALYLLLHIDGEAGVAHLRKVRLPGCEGFGEESVVEVIPLEDDFFVNVYILHFVEL